MSYYFSMNFANVKNKLEAFELAQKFIKETWIIRKDIMENSISCVPSLRYPNANKTTDEYWLYSLFQFRFVYWEKYNLLGVLMANRYQSIKKLFPYCVEFQNSCDQDYEYEMWKGIPYFESVVKKYQDMSNEEIVEKEKDWFDYEEMDIEYVKKSLVYKEIYESLDLDTWLGGNPSDVYEQITLSPIYDAEQIFMLSMQLQKTIKEKNF